MHFKNQQQEKIFLRDGYVILDDLYSLDDVSYLKSLFKQELHQYKGKEGGTYSSYDAKNLALIKKINAEIEARLKPKLDNIFFDYHYLLSSFLVKEPGEDNNTGYHQDPTMIDQEPHISAGLWCPLQEVSTKNGCLKMIPGTHRFGKVLVVTPDFKTTFHKFKNKLNKFAISIPLSPGQGVLFNNKTIHGSFPNRSKLNRIATVTALKSSNSDWLYYFNNKKLNVVEKYVMDKNTYIAHNTGSQPLAPLIDQFSYKFDEKNYLQFTLFMLKNYPKFTMNSLFNIKE